MLVKNIIPILKNSQTPNFNHLDFDVSLDFFECFVRFRTQNKGLDGLCDNILPNLHSAYITDVGDWTFVSRLATNLESYLKKIVYIKDSFTITETFSKVLQHKKLELNQEIIKKGFSFTNTFSFQKMETLKNEPEFLYHIGLAYLCRNEVHNAPDLTQAEVSSRRDSILIVYLYATFKFQEILISKYLGINSYLNFVKLEYERWQDRFIHLKGQYIESIVYGTLVEFGEKQNVEIREGIIDNIRKEVRERKIIVVGDAGMGKTTTLQFLASKDAEYLLNNFENLDDFYTLPIFIELNMLFTENVHVENLVFEKLCAGLKIVAEDNIKRSLLSQYFESLSKKGFITIFFDGLNEIPEIFVQSKRDEVRNFVQKYNKNSYVITSRREDYRGNFSNIPMFALKEMDIEQIKLFLDKNAKNEDTRKKILEAIENKDVVFNFLQVPYLLMVLIRIVDDKKEIPKNKFDIFKEYVKSLYEIEKGKNHNFPNDKIHLVLVKLATRIVEKLGNAANPTLSDEQICRIFSETSRDLGFQNLDSQRTLTTVNELRILIKRGDRKYAFTHQFLLEYFAAEGVNEIEL